MDLDPELFPEIRQVVPAGGQQLPVPAGTDIVTAGSINDYDSRLISDLAANIRFQADVLKQYGITQEQLAQKMLNPGFAAHYRETVRTWNSDLKAPERIRAKAAFLLEDTLPVLHGIAKGQQVPANAKLAAIEQLTKISTIANVPKDNGSGGEKHSITINIGGGKEPVIINAETTK